jgi:predicted small secreted protein
MFTKKNLRLRLITAVLAIAALSLAGCGDPEDGGGKDVTLVSVAADGGAAATTTALTITFDKAIDGLNADDITLSGVEGVTKGALGGAGPEYTLPISGFDAGGTLSVAVKKKGFTISGSPKTVAVFRFVPLSVCNCYGVKDLCVCDEGDCECLTCEPLQAGYLVIVGVAAANRVYDGTTTVTLTGGQLVGVAAGDTVNFNLGTLGGGSPAQGSGTGKMDDKNAGNNKAVDTNITLVGTDANKYTLIKPTITVNIAPKPLTISGVSATARAYNATTAVALTGGTLQSGAIISGDTVTFTLGSGTLANKNAGENKAVTTAITLTGADAGNYALTQPSLTVSISKKNITSSAMTATNREYNDLLTVALTGGTLSGVESGDTVSISGGEGTMANINAGNNKAVTVSSVTLGGADAGNYNVSPLPTSGTVNINPGTGTTADPWRVAAEADLRAVGTSSPSGWTLAAHYKLTATKGIDLTGKTAWTIIGHHIVNTNHVFDPFTGTFDGNGHTITGLSCNNTGLDDDNPPSSGMFYVIETGGVVKNLRLVNVNIHFTGNVGQVGGVAARNKGTVENCFVSGSATGTGESDTGGVVGANSGMVQNCYSTCNVSGTNPVGGIVGNNSTITDNGTVQNCYSTGSVTTSGATSGTTGGGIVGKNNSGTVQNCVALNTSITTTGSPLNSQFARIAGSPAPNTLTNNHAKSDISGTWNNKSLTGWDGADVTSATYGTQAFWQNTLGWNFTTIWEWDSVTHLPKLR